MPDRAMRPAVFLDRDGTISEEMGYANHLSRFCIFPYAGAAIRRLNDAGFAVIVVTNQSGAARGFFPESLVQEIHKKMEKQLAAAGAHVDGIYYCPHIRDDNCECRKPLPGMVKRAVAEHNIDLRRSVLVSDRYDDISMAHAVGCKAILVFSGYGRGEYEWNRQKWPQQPDHVVENLQVAVDLICSQTAAKE